MAISASMTGPFLSQSMSSPPHWLLSFLTQPSYSPKSLRKRWYLVSLNVKPVSVLSTRICSRRPRSRISSSCASLWMYVSWLPCLSRYSGGWAM